MCNVLVMKMGAGVEWGIHCCLTLAWLEGEGPVPIGRLATWFDLPSEYLKKRLQVLARAGILESTPGVQGGFRLGRRPERITLMDIVAALEGPAKTRVRATATKARSTAAKAGSTTATKARATATKTRTAAKPKP